MNKQNIIFVLGIIILLVCGFFVGRCTKECPTIPVKIPITIPEQKGSFESPTVFTPINNTKDSLVYSTVNEELLDRYLALKLEKDNDSIDNLNELEGLKMFKDAITINEYENVFENDKVKLTIKTKTEGKLLQLSPDWIVKEQTFEQTVNVPKPKEKYFSMNLGAGLNTSQRLDKLEPTANIDLTFKNGDILSGGYGLDGTISVKYSKTLFSLKK